MAVGPSAAPEAVFTALAALAATLCQTPMALISLVTPLRQQLVAQVGLGESGAALPHLAWTIETLNHVGLLRVSDVAHTPHWRDDLLASGPAGIRFYAGITLHRPRSDHSPEEEGVETIRRARSSARRKLRQTIPLRKKGLRHVIVPANRVPDTDSQTIPLKKKGLRPGPTE